MSSGSCGLANACRISNDDRLLTAVTKQKIDITGTSARRYDVFICDLDARN
jgi:hypothetical protein